MHKFCLFYARDYLLLLPGACAIVALATWRIFLNHVFPPFFMKEMELPRLCIKSFFFFTGRVCRVLQRCTFCNYCISRVCVALGFSLIVIYHPREPFFIGGKISEV